MPAKISLVGKRFGRLFVISEAPVNRNVKDPRLRSRCVCDCGNETIVTNRDLSNGHTQSCGCLQRDNRVKHGFVDTTTYVTWKAMIQRCTNPANTSFRNYGARGIKVHKPWMQFANFLKDVGIRPPNKSLNRIDNDGDYAPGNVCWSNQKEQNRNTRRNRVFTVNGMTASLADLCDVFGADWKRVWTRLDRGWTIELALFHPYCRGSKKVKAQLK